MIVVDTNLVMYFVIEGTYHEEAQEVSKRDAEWAVPALWQSEFLNATLNYVRKGTLSEEAALLHFYEAERIVQVEREPPAALVMQLAVAYGLSAYDATYAALAQHLGVPFVTYDKQVCKAGAGMYPRDFLDP